MSIEQALEAEAAAIARRYRVDHDDAVAALRDAMRDPRLAAAVETEVARNTGRGKALRRLAKEARKHVYHDLRRYTLSTGEQDSAADALAAAIERDDDGAVGEAVSRLLETHASTRERLPSYDAFFATVSAAVARPAAIVDLGAGLHPLAPAPADLTPEVYVALEKDERAARILEAYARRPRPTRLVTRRVDLGEVDWDEIREAAGVETFDLAYLLKLVPVLRRQQPAALERVARTPARTLVVTGSREALTRRTDISRREDRVLRKFVDSLSPSSVERSETGDEIVYIVRR